MIIRLRRKPTIPVHGQHIRLSTVLLLWRARCRAFTGGRGHHKHAGHLTRTPESEKWAHGDAESTYSRAWQTSDNSTLEKICGEGIEADTRLDSTSDGQSDLLHLRLHAAQDFESRAR
ncbi:hypothetical protein BKA80DRAFT_128134 [Phyllosticta citrichinensis]